jgi:type II secretory pathway pseudopilin PulG
VRKFIVIACVAFVVPAISVSKISAQSEPTHTSICDMPEMVGTAMYNKYCGSVAPSAPAVGGGGVTPQQQFNTAVGTAVGGAIANMVLQSINGNPQADAARQAAAAQAALRQQEQAQRAVREQQRRAAELQRRAEEIKSQLIGTTGADSDASLPLMRVGADTDDTTDLKLMTLDQSPPPPNTTAPQAVASKPSTGCTPSQDPSVVDLCGHGDTVDPSVVKNGGVRPASTSTAGTTVGPTVSNQGSSPCPFVNGEPQCGQAFKMERNQPCPLDANGVPQCGAPTGEEMPGGNANAIPAAAPAPPSPPQSAYDPNLSGQARQDAAARSAYQASAEEDAGVAHDGAQLQHQAANVGEKTVEGAVHSGTEFGPDGAVIGGALGAGHGMIENHFENENGN